MSKSLATVVANPTVTMSSREIADLVESRHDSVKRTIERLAQSKVISRPPLVDGIKAANGLSEQIFKLDRRSSIIVVAQLCPEFTARVVDRWMELEAQQKPTQPKLKQPKTTQIPSKMTDLLGNIFGADIFSTAN